MSRPRWTRRAVLPLFAAAGAIRAGFGQGTALPSETLRYLDAATEFPVWRLTDPAHTSRLPGRSGRFIAHRGEFLLFWSDRSGSPQAFRKDTRSGAIEQLTQASDLDGSSLSMASDDGGFYYFDGPALKNFSFSRKKQPERVLYEIPEGWSKGPGFAIEGDGTHAVVIEQGKAGSRIRLIGLGRGAVRTVLELSEPAGLPLPRPRRDSVLYRRGDSLWLADYDGRRNRRLTTAPGVVGQAFWSPDGKSVLYLSLPAASGRLNEIREVDPDTGADSLVATTSQFAGFGMNGDGSVLVGASASKASPYVLLLLRLTRREMALCEHKASDPSRVAPVFSPDSRRIFFESDRDGRPAIYAMPVDRLVEETPS
jgi:oligogalacturonide lyase